MNLLLSPVSLVGILSTAGVWHGHVLFDCRSHCARELQASWDRSVMIRTPLLVASLIAQSLALLAISA